VSITTNENGFAALGFSFYDKRVIQVYAQDCIPVVWWVGQGKNLFVTLFSGVNAILPNTTKEVYYYYIILK
jgi:hypothetical protein